METSIRQALRVLKKIEPATSPAVAAVRVDCAIDILEECLPKIGNVPEQKPEKKEAPVKKKQEEVPEEKKPIPPKGEYVLDLDQHKQILSIKDAKGQEVIDDHAVELDGAVIAYKYAKGQTVQKTCKVL